MMRSHQMIRRTVAIVAATGLVVTACGDDDGDGPAADVTTTTAAADAPDDDPGNTGTDTDDDTADDDTDDTGTAAGGGAPGAAGVVTVDGNAFPMQTVRRCELPDGTDDDLVVFVEGDDGEFSFQGVPFDGDPSQQIRWATDSSLHLGMFLLRDGEWVEGVEPIGGRPGTVEGDRLVGAATLSRITGTDSPSDITVEFDIAIPDPADEVSC